jgi:hypothetical protein
LLTLVLLSPMGALIAGARRPAFGSPATVTAANRVTVPYGVAIAAAALIVTVPPNFN